MNALETDPERWRACAAPARHSLLDASHVVRCGRQNAVAVCRNTSVVLDRREPIKKFAAVFPLALLNKCPVPAIQCDRLRLHQARIPVVHASAYKRGVKNSIHRTRVRPERRGVALLDVILHYRLIKRKTKQQL